MDSNAASRFHDHLQQDLQVEYENTMQFYPISLSLFLFFFIFLFLKLFRNKKTTLKSPPSPPKLPIIGNLHQLGTLPHRSLASLSEKYGPLMFLKLGQIPTLVVSSAKMAREIMKTHDLNFSNRPQTTAPNLLMYGCKDVGFASYGDYWKQAKKLCVVELLSVKRVESFQYVRDEEVALLIDRIRKACDIDGDKSVNIYQLLVSTSNNMISRCVFGDKFEDENENCIFGNTLRRVIVLLTAFCVTDFFPIFRWIDVFRGFIGELKRKSATLDTFFNHVIEEHKAKMSKIDKTSFLDIMLQLQQDDKFDYPFTQDNLKAILLDMFIGGTDTISTSLEWTMTELLRKPIVMKKLQEEVRKIVGKKSKIEMNDIEKMEYMKCVMKESLRLHPSAPLLAPREASEIVTIEGYHIPAKTRVFINAWAIQRDPEIWERPNDFIPERFMNSSIGFQSQDCEFMPFGSGRRTCPGLSFAIVSFEYVLANLLYWFDWKLPDGNVMDLDEENGLTVRKKTSLHLNPIPFYMI